MAATMILQPSDVTIVANGLDHPECVCTSAGDELLAGGEKGQLYSINPASQSYKEIGTSGGFTLGIAADGDGCIHSCDMVKRAVLLFDREGNVTTRASGTPGAPMN